MKQSKKKWVIIALALVVLALAVWAGALIVKRNTPQLPEHRPGPPAAPQQAGEGNATPSGAVIGLVEALRSWDLGLAAQWMALAPDGPFTEAYHSVLSPVLSRLELEVGAERILGDTAMVDVSVTAVDVGGALGDMSAEAAAYLVTGMLEGAEAEWGEFLADYLSRLDAGELLRVRRDATVHLIRDSGGKWRIDTAGEENAAFFNALTGGLIETAQRLESLRNLGP